MAAAAAFSRFVPLTITATGAFASNPASEVAPAAAGRVAAAPVEVGDFVRRGAVLVRLEDRDARLRLSQAQAAVRQAEAALREARTRVGIAAGGAFDPARVPEAQAAQAAYRAALAREEMAEADARRYEALVATGDVSRSAYQQAQTQAQTARAEAEAARRQYEAALSAARQGFAGVGGADAAVAAARAELGLAQKALADTLVRAPFAGHVAARPVSPGEFVGTAESVATLVRLQPIELELQLPEAASGRVEPGLGVEARVAAYPDRVFRGRVSAINPSVGSESRAFTVIASFANADNALRPGMFATAEVLLPEEEQAVYIPREALIEEHETSSWQVYVIENGRAWVRVVQTGEAENGNIRILSGVAPGEAVAVSNLRELFDGVRVEVRRGA